MPEQGVTVLYSSHLLSEVEEVCTRVAIVNGGRISFEGRLDQLRESFDAPYRLETGDDERALVAATASGAHDARIENGTLYLDAAPEIVDRLTVALGRAGIPIRSLTRERRTLEDLFFQLTEEDGQAA
jgi:ABC-2 type transport system ATP-binding protein